MKYIDSEDFINQNYTEHKLPQGEYDNCYFKNCDFSNSDLSHCSFLECKFENCNLSNVKLHQTALKDIQFTKSKMLGVDFSICNDFLLSVQFSECQLNFCSFYQLDLKNSSFEICELQEVDFMGANLNEISFTHCNLLQAQFENSNLESTDFRTATNYIIDLDQNQIRQAKFSQNGLNGLLAKYDIHIE